MSAGCEDIRLPVPSRIIGQSASISRARSIAQRLAATRLPLLLVGATGTGKELFAEEIHAWSGRRGPLVDVNCGALPRDMAEGLLFGHRRGAFTGAHEDAKGLLEAADGGTLFLDELTSLPLELQPKLLRALESGEIRRLGETVKRRVELRVVSAAQPVLLRLLRTGEFREDLFQRLAGAVVALPPLAERRDDIPELGAAIVHHYRRRLSEGAVHVLQQHSWPGNVRELRLVVERSVHLSEHQVIPASAIREALVAGTLPSADMSPATPISARERVLALLDANGWSVERTAQLLGLGRTTLFKELKALGISLRTARADVAWRAERRMEE